MAGTEEKPAERKTSGKESKGRLLDWLDVMAKLVGAAAVLGVAVIANTFQSRVTGVSIQSQREQAESQLRASMFSSLIGPIAGPQSGKVISADREALLAELLALNFHENFELKPLLEDAAESAHKADTKRGADSRDAREPLWSIARRIAERQKASIAWEWSATRSNRAKQEHWWNRLSGSAPPAGCEFYTLTVNTEAQAESETRTCELSVGFGSRVRLNSPDNNYTLQMTLVHPDWTNQKVDVVVLPFLSGQGRPLETDTTYRFPLSWFDFPFTDNTLLPDGNRFAIYLRLISAEVPQKLTAVVVWFPKGYFTPRERPLNYSEVQQILGRESQ
jgi:hypothetical protein